MKVNTLKIKKLSKKLLKSMGILFSIIFIPIGLILIGFQIGRRFPMRTKKTDVSKSTFDSDVLEEIIRVNESEIIEKQLDEKEKLKKLKNERTAVLKL